MWGFEFDPLPETTVGICLFLTFLSCCVHVFFSSIPSPRHTYYSNYKFVSTTFILLGGDSIRSILKPLIESPETWKEAASCGSSENFLGATFYYTIHN